MEFCEVLWGFFFPLLVLEHLYNWYFFMLQYDCTNTNLSASSLFLMNCNEFLLLLSISCFFKCLNFKRASCCCYPQNVCSLTLTEMHFYFTALLLCLQKFRFTWQRRGLQSDFKMIVFLLLSTTQMSGMVETPTCELQSENCFLWIRIDSLISVH